MIEVDVEQGSAAWAALRLGLPTASCFDRIVSPKKLQASSQAPAYRNQLLAEWLLGYPMDFGGSQWTQRGTGMEAEARAYFELQNDVEVRRVGFCLRDDGKAGCSPDGLIGEDEGLELKCPGIHTHIGYLLSPLSLLDEHRSQVQGGLYITGRERWHLLSYHPNLPAVHVVVEPDAKHVAALAAGLDVFIERLDAAKERLAQYRTVRVTEAAA
jgi:hypothetical protein